MLDTLKSAATASRVWENSTRQHLDGKTLNRIIFFYRRRQIADYT